MVETGSLAPDFTLVGDDNTPFTLSEHRGRRLLLVFYPGDDTPVCTRQFCDYRDGIESFAELGVDVVGINPAGLESHRRFREKHDLPFKLLSDPDLEVARAYGCKGILGVKRAVFLVDEQGVVRYAFVEALAMFRRTAEELVAVINELDSEAAES